MEPEAEYWSWVAPRAAAAAERSGEPPVTDLRASNSALYRVGRLEVLEGHLEVGVPEDRLERARQAVRESGVPEALRVRGELVSYKKLLLHVQADARVLERRLKQLATFYRKDVVDEGGWWSHSRRSERLHRALSATRGALGVVTDLRMLVKGLCALPRHPDAGAACADRIAALPASLANVRKFVGSARRHLGDGDFDASPVPPASPVPHGAVLEALRGFGWPGHLVDFVGLACIASGASKCLAIHHEARRLAEALARCSADADALLARLRRLPEPGPEAARLRASANMSAEDKYRAMTAALQTASHVDTLGAATAALHDARRWVDAIVAVPELRLFVAGDSARDGDGAMFVPSGFATAALFHAPRRVVDEHLPAMRAALREHGWPESVSVTDRAADAQKHRRCDGCGSTIRELWVAPGRRAGTGACVACELAARDELRCPFGAGCSPAAFCPHKQACLVCDVGFAGCDACRLTRGDGEDVAELVERLRSDGNGSVRVFLDFDRTLASTRTGACPDADVHSADEELVALAQALGTRVSVVTRNPHAVEIAAFLRAKGAPASVSVRVVRKGESKADAVLESLPDADDRAVFVDDTVAEHMDPRLAGDRRVHRVLFSRAL